MHFILLGCITEVEARIPDATHDHRPHVRNDVVLVKVRNGDVLLDLKLVQTLWNVETVGFDKLDSIFDRPRSNAEAERPPAVPRGNPEAG